MARDLAAELNELELDALWTIYEGHSLVIERPQREDIDPSANAILSVAFDEEDEAVAEAAEIPLDTVVRLIELGLIERSEDGPVLDASSWFDEELGCEVLAEEYVISRSGQLAIDATADGSADSVGYYDEDDDDDEEDDDDLDWDDDDDLDLDEDDPFGANLGDDEDDDSFDDD